MNNRTTLPAPRIFVVGAFLLVAIVLTACTGGSDSWAGVSGEAGEDTIVVSYKNLVINLRADKSRAWSYEGDGEADFFAPPLITDEHVYVGDYKGRVHAIRRDDGDAVWVYEREGNSFLGFDFGASDRVIAPMGIADDVVFVGDEHGVFAVRADDGEPDEIWNFETDHAVWAQPLYVDELEPTTLLVASLDQHLYALDPATGEKLWDISLDGAIPNKPILDVERGRLYVGTLNYHVFAIDYVTGEEIDRFEAEGWVWGTPVIHQDRLYFGDLRGYVYEVELTDEGFGDDWRLEIAESAVRSAVVVIDDVLVAASEDKKVYALNVGDKSLKWERDVESEAVTDMTWVMDEGEPLIVVGTKDDDQLLVAIRVSDGDRRWSYEYND